MSLMDKCDDDPFNNYRPESKQDIDKEISKKLGQVLVDKVDKNIAKAIDRMKPQDYGRSIIIGETTRD